MDSTRVNAHWDLAQAYEQKGMYNEAVAEYLEAAALSGESPETIMAYREGYARAGMRGFWQKKLEVTQDSMKFLLDQDVYATTARFLSSLGHDVVLASQIGLSQADYDKQNGPNLTGPF